MFPETELEEGFASAHRLPALPIYAAPSTRDQFRTSNKLRVSLNPVACWRMNDARFEFDSSFVLPEAARELAVLGRMVTLQPEAPLSVFGHADPVGKDDYNLVLGARRAKSIYGLLLHDAGIWEALFSSAFGGDDWAARHVTGTMLGTLGYSADKAEVKRFQRENGLSPDDGKVGHDTRQKLFAAYMAALFPPQLKPQAFLGRGADPKNRADFQSCGEFNPIALLSANESQKLPAAKRKVENSANRRVVVFFYQPGLRLDPAQWPCPAAPMAQQDASAALSTCKGRFWSDGETRRKAAADSRRAFKDTHDTFACRFYQRNAGWSPCEGGQKLRHWVIRLLNPGGPPLTAGTPLANEPFVAIAGSGGTRRTVGCTDGAGVLRVRLQEPAAQLAVRIAGTELVFDAGALQPLAETGDARAGAGQRLYNLGYGSGDPASWGQAELAGVLRRFQSDQGVGASEAGTLGPATRAKLVEVYGG
jgi:outer membrane protein OmpA-like peptidoglycan-associated protein